MASTAEGRHPGRKRPRRGHHTPPRQQDAAVPDIEVEPEIGETQPYVPLHDHAWLQFPMEDPCYTRLATVVEQPIMPMMTIDWGLLSLLGVKERAEAILTTAWRRLLDMREPSIEVLTREFHSTFQVTSTGTSLDYAMTLEFQLGGKDRQMSITQFGVHMGVYTEEETHQPIYRESLQKIDPTELVTWWPEIGDGAFQSSVRASWIRDPLHRYIHRVLARTISGRHDGGERVSLMDAFYLYCLLRPAPCNLATSLVSYFAKRKGKRATGHLGGGAFITRLAASIGVFADIDRSTLGTTEPTGLLGILVMEQMDLVVTFPDGQRCLVPTRPAPEEPAQAGEGAEGKAAALARPFHPPPPPTSRIRAPPRVVIRGPAPPAGGNTGDERVFAALLGLQRSVDRAIQLAEGIYTHLGLPLPPPPEQQQPDPNAAA